MFRRKLGAKLYKECTLIANNYIKREDQLIELINILEENEDRFLKKLTLAQDGSIQCVHYIDKFIGNHYNQKENFDVFCKDVTWGVCDGNCGLHKLSTIAALTPDKRLKPLMFTLLSNETKENFIAELSFFIDSYPWLEMKDRRISWFVDGDDQNIYAIEQLMPNSVVIFCLFHLAGMKNYTLIFLLFNKD